MCTKLPTPADAQTSLPGSFFARAMSSLTEFAGTLGWTVSVAGPSPILATGMKDFRGSNFTV